MVKIRPGDLIFVDWGASMGPRSCQVTQEGEIYVPVAGDLVVEGKTPAEVALLIHHGLEKELHNFTVTVDLALSPMVPVAERDIPHVTIGGAVNRPLTLLYRD